MHVRACLINEVVNPYMVCSINKQDIDYIKTLVRWQYVYRVYFRFTITSYQSPLQYFTMEACCVDPVPNNDMVQSKVTQLLDFTKNLLSSQPPMLTAIDEVREAERVLEIDLVHIKAISDSKLAFMLINLLEEVDVFIQVCNDFLESCRSMAKYAIYEKQLNEIWQELKGNRLEKLKLYLDSLSEYFESCKSSFKEFKKAYKKIVSRINSDKEKLEIQLKQVQENTNDIRGKHEEAVVARKSREGGTTTLGVITGGTNVAAAFTGILLPLTVVIQSLFSYFSSFFARFYEGAAIKDVMKQKRMREDLAKKKKMSQDALNGVVKIKYSVANTASNIKRMKSYIDRVSALIEQKKGLKKYAHPALPHKEPIRRTRARACARASRCAPYSRARPIDYDFECKLNTLQEYAHNILNGIGKDPDKLVSNARLHHETEPTFQNVIEFSDSDSDEYPDERKPLLSDLDTPQI